MGAFVVEDFVVELAFVEVGFGEEETALVEDTEVLLEVEDGFVEEELLVLLLEDLVNVEVNFVELVGLVDELDVLVDEVVLPVTVAALQAPVMEGTASTPIPIFTTFEPQST